MTEQEKEEAIRDEVVKYLTLSPWQRFKADMKVFFYFMFKAP